MRTLDLRNTRGWERETAHRIRPVGGFVSLEPGVLACGDEAAEEVVEGPLVVDADAEVPVAGLAQVPGKVRPYTSPSV